ncbi:D-isomer specific 2-hydroxyacid dehydrogenase family protein [Paenibacillus sp. YYML68]|uniref:NAD(P)-dependent oxidoreductase n=1 Tax=Paenibacillus sp. YYML68 TaxID=2909250 RepID=UPI002491B086|nr:NAD(P)-dependent oxidoreductase [Paenibacillus sp. YYML68]
MRVAILDTIWSGARELFEQSGFEVNSQPEGSEVIIVRSGIKLRKDDIDYLYKSGLRLILRAGSGLDNIDTVTCKSLGIEVVAFPGLNANSVAEVTLAFMLATSHRLWEGGVGLVKGEFRKNQLWGENLTNKKIAIIGYGKTGRATTQLLLNLGVKKVYVHTRSKLNDDMNGKVISSSLEECLTADIISLHVPLTASTIDLINHENVNKLKKGTILINMARREVVNHEAVKAAILTQTISSYASDVLDPIMDHDLLSKDNVLATPHLGAQCESIQEEIARNMNEWLKKWRVEHEHIRC